MIIAWIAIILLGVATILNSLISISLQKQIKGQQARIEELEKENAEQYDQIIDLSRHYANLHGQVKNNQN